MTPRGPLRGRALQVFATCDSSGSCPCQPQRDGLHVQYWQQHECHAVDHPVEAADQRCSSLYRSPTRDAGGHSPDILWLDRKPMYAP